MSSFNPPPARRPGETSGLAHPIYEVLFQPAPGPKARGNPRDMAQGVTPWRFNPPPARRPGENSGPGGCRQRWRVLTPPPAPRAGETSWALAAGAGRGLFNPPPARRPGETRARRCRWDAPDVSTRPRPEGQGKRQETALFAGQSPFQPAPGPKARG